MIFIKVVSRKVFQNCVTDSTDTVGFSSGFFLEAGATGVFPPSQPSKLGRIRGSSREVVGHTGGCCLPTPPPHYAAPKREITQSSAN